MDKFIEVTGKTVDEAVETGLAQLGVTRDDVTVEVLDFAKSGFLGIGGTPARVKLTYAVGLTQKAELFLTGLLNRMHMNAHVEVNQDDEGHLHIELTGGDVGSLIGRHGETLDALQYITSQVCNRDEDKRVRVSVDAQGYRRKREEILIAQAMRAAEKAVKYRKNFALESMNSFERHVVHTALQDVEGVTTSSVGNEPRRCVVVLSVEGGQPAHINNAVHSNRGGKLNQNRGNRRPGMARPLHDD